MHIAENSLTSIAIILAIFCFQEYGIKGPTALALLPSFNLVKGIAVDYMHCILLGVCRLLLRLWLNTEHHQSLWYIGGKTEEMDELLFKIKPPDEIKRVPRSFQTVKYWKGIMY